MMGPEDENVRFRWLGIATLVASAALWSLAGPLIKMLSAEGVPGVSIACYRSLLGAIVIAPLALRGRRTLRSVHGWWPVGSLICFTLMTACFVIGNTYTAAANVISLQYTSAIWVFVLSPLLLGVRPRRSEGVWLLLALGGVAVIFSEQWRTDLFGLTIALGAGATYGTLTVTLRGMRAANPTTIIGLNLFGSAALLLPWALSAGMALSAKAAVLAVVLGIVQLGVPYVLFAWALRHVHAHQAALIVLLEVIMNPLLTWVVVGERPPASTLIGGPLILAGVIGWMVASWVRDASNRRTIL